MLLGRPDVTDLVTLVRSPVLSTTVGQKGVWGWRAAGDEESTEHLRVVVVNEKLNL